MKLRTSTFDGAVALLSPCGWGNLGDAAILDSTIAAIRRHCPGTPIIALTLNPHDTAERHGIAAYACSGMPLPFYAVDRHPVTDPASANSGSIERLTDLGSATSRSSALRSWFTHSRCITPARWGLAVARLPADIRYRSELAKTLPRLSAIIVAGGGQLDDTGAGAFGHPMTLYRWSSYSRSTGTPLLFLSVGTGTLRTPVARWMVRRALSRATWRSFRDTGSRALVDARCTDPVVPDLAFDLTPSVTSDRPTCGPDGQTSVGISPMSIWDPEVWASGDAARYRRYIREMCTLCVRVLQSGRQVVLFGTDGADADHAVGDLAMAVRAAAPEADRHLRIADVRSVAALFDTIAPLEVVVTSRLHGALLSHVARRPVLALGYERKVVAHMRDMGQERWSLPVEVSGDEAWERLQELIEQQRSVAEEVAAHVAHARNCVERQFMECLSMISTSGSHDS